MSAATAVGIELALKATVVLGLAMGAIALMRTRSGSERHLVWLAAMFTLLVLPAAERFAPRWEIGVSNVRQLAAPLLDAPLRAGRVRSLSEDSPGARVGAVGRDRGAGVAGSDSAVPWWLFCWAFGALLVSGRQLLGMVGARAVVRRARPCDDPRILALTRDAATRVGLRGTPPVYLTHRLGLPAVAGQIRPSVLLPARAAEWPDETLTAVLLHELAHVRRADVAVHTLVGLISAFYWPHPGVWLASRRLRAERERACDDAALAAGVNPEGYARCLLELASTRRDGSRTQPGLAMARIDELEGRLVGVLDGRTRRAGHSPEWSATCAVAAAVVGVLLGGAGVAAAGDHTPTIERVQVGAATNAGGTLSPADDLEAYRSRFLGTAQTLIAAALESLFANDPDVVQASLDEVAGRAAHDLWMMLDVRITVPADSPRTGLRAWAEGNSRISIVRGAGPRTTAVVSTLSGPLPRSLPARVLASLRVEGFRVDDNERERLGESLRHAGAELERRWATVITGGRATWQQP